MKFNNSFSVLSTGRALLIPILMLAALQACAPRQQGNQFTKDLKLGRATLIDPGARGNFVASTDVSATDVKSTDVFTNGCTTQGIDGSTSQNDSRLAQGDQLTEDFQDSSFNGTRRSFSKNERVASFETASPDIKFVGQIQSGASSLEYTRQCSTVTAGSSQSSTVSCTVSPMAAVAAATDESEPCSFFADETQTNRTRGTYKPPRSTSGAAYSAFQVKVVERGNLNCGSSTYKNINRTSIEVVSNDIPSFETAMCGGTVLYRYVIYQDDAKTVYYNSRKELNFGSRF